MKILHVIANLAPCYGGPPKAAFEMARAVAKLGHQVSIYTTNQAGATILDVPLYQPVLQEGVEIRYFPIQFPRFWGTSLPLAAALREKIPTVDVVHLHSLYLFHNAVTGYYCRRYHIPYLMLPHGTLDPFLYKRHRSRKKIMEWGFENRNIKTTQAMHFLTEEEKTLAKPYIFNAPSVVIPLGLDGQEYAHLPPPGTFKSRYPHLQDKQIILFLGRIHFKKGFDLLIPAFIQVAQQHPTAHLVIAGPDDGLATQLQAKLRAANLLQRVTFTGMLLGEDKLAVLRDAAVFVLPSYSENFGIAVIEAMVCGVPVIISDKVNLWREVKENQAGIVISCDKEQLIHSLCEVLDNPEMARKLGDNGKELVAQQFQWDSIAVRLEQVYQALSFHH